MSSISHDHPDGDSEPERSQKRLKLETSVSQTPDPQFPQQQLETDKTNDAEHFVTAPGSGGTEDSTESALPPSGQLLGKHPGVHGTASHHIEEFDVGISEYISRDLPQFHAIIKQRYTDFLVNEVNLDGEVVHLKSIAMPRSDLKKHKEAISGVNIESTDTGGSEVTQDDSAAKSANIEVGERPTDATKDIEDDPAGPWLDRFDDVLREYLTEQLVAKIKEMVLAGPDAFVSDSGWAGRQVKVAESSFETEQGPGNATTTAGDGEVMETGGKGARGKGQRGRRGQRGRGGRTNASKLLSTEVLTNPISSKEARSGLHSAIRELFKGKLDTETDATKTASGEGPRIVIRWAGRGASRRGGRGGSRSGCASDGDRDAKPPRGTYPPYIHFTLQKTNRDTQDALSHLSRIMRVSVKDLSVAGTKDKRGVTVQRVSLKRNNKSVEDVWKLANGQFGRRTLEDALTQRGERGVRIGDLSYRKASLELGMLKGNAFLITLRGVQVDSLETLNKAMISVKTLGFINYYGMQRFGTATIPTHAIGLALLQSDWHKAVSLILRHRHGEHPDVAAARDAWLKEGDLDKALALMPRRVVAERCILESYKKQGGDTRNAMGALSTIPRNLRLMYVHAYQSYVWNAIVSERIRQYGAGKPVIGDVVYVKQPDEKGEDATVGEEQGMEMDVDDTEPQPQPLPQPQQSSRRSRKPWVAPEVKTLMDDDVDKYTIFDVIMPLPGKDIAYPGGLLGKRYREFLKVDGLDPDNLVRKQKDYSLSGSYRKIVHLPKNLSWKVLRYTDPDVPLAQADEDRILGFEPPVFEEGGKFIALQVQMELGTAAYATMALRELTKTDTSSHHQTSLTQASEDQAFRGTVGGNTDDAD